MLTGIYGEEVSPSFEKHCADLRNERIQGVTWTRDYRGFIEAFHLDKSHTMTCVAISLHTDLNFERGLGRSQSRACVGAKAFLRT
jgi:hypothetical protein